jgi:Ca-activated chloride channel family protein
MKKIIFFLAMFTGILVFSFRAQEKSISGYIHDENGNAVSATVTGGKKSINADANGYYEIKVVSTQKVLIFSASGFVTQKIQILNRANINVILKKSTTLKDSIVKDDLKISEAETHIYDKMARVKSTGTANSLYAPSPTVLGYNRPENYNTEEYSNIEENGFKRVTDNAVSTFSIDVDAASYSNVRRYLNGNQLPPAGAVRSEEMINYFSYRYPQPIGKDPFSINTEISECPWNKENKLVLIGLQGKRIATENLPASNLVFLIDVSGSMMDENKLPLVQASLKMLTDQLREKDRISIVVYAGNAGLVLPSTSGADKIKIKTAINQLEAGGSTAGGEGIKLAYKTAQEHFMKEGNNRIILCTDGDFNVGASSDDDMVRLVEKERNKGIYLTVLGYGMGNYKDSKMELLADKGNGNHAYIDGINEAKKVLVNEFGGTLFTIAKDVKLQVEFNPAVVAGYRLIGYENRLLNKEDFNDDKKDAGELGSGHTVTALYEIIPVGVNSPFLKNVDPLKYQQNKSTVSSDFNGEILTVKFRYKNPTRDNSELIVHSVKNENTDLNKTSNNFRFAASVASFAMLLRNSEYKGNLSFEKVLNLATSSLGTDAEGYRKEFIGLVEKAQKLESATAKN